MDIKYDPEPTLARFHASDKFFRGIRGPIGSGKSVACVMEIISRCMEMPPDSRGRRRSRWAIVRNTTAQLRDTTLKTFVEWIPEELCTITRSPRITGRIDSPLSDGTRLDVEVIFLPMDHPRSERDLLSLELTGIWFNEARELPLNFITAGLSRCGRFPRSADVPHYWSGGIADTNSPDTFHWWYHRAVEKTPENWEFFDQPPALLCENGKYLPNPAAENIRHQPKGARYYLDMVDGADPDWLDVMVLCHYKSLFDGKPVYQPFWNENIHVSKTPLPVERNRELYLAFDFGLTPACVAGQLMPNGQLRILREWCSENMGLRQFCRDLLLPDLSRDFNGMRYVVTGDPAGAQRSQVDRDDSCYAELARNGLSCTAARTNDFEPRRRAVINRLTYLAGGEPGYLLDPSCQMLRQGFTGGYMFELINRVGEGGTLRYREQPAKNIFSHIHDANQYLCLYLQPEATAVRDGFRRMMDDNRRRMNRLRERDILEV